MTTEKENKTPTIHMGFSPTRKLHKQLGIKELQSLGLTSGGDQIFYQTLHQINMLDGGTKERRVTSPCSNMVDALKPQSAAETLLATQLVNLHMAQNYLIGRIEEMTQLNYVRVSNGAMLTSLVNSLTKLSNASSNLALSMKKLQQPNSEAVKVNDVVVNKGGQAVVGNVTHHSNARPKDKDHKQAEKN